MSTKCPEKQKSKARQSMEVIPKKARDKARGSLREIAVNGINSPTGDTGIVQGVSGTGNKNLYFGSGSAGTGYLAGKKTENL